MGNGEWGMGNGEWGMGNGEWVKKVTVTGLEKTSRRGAGARSVVWGRRARVEGERGLKESEG